MKIYLCGAINGCTDNEAKDWREAVKAHFAVDGPGRRVGDDWQFIDPMRNDYRGRENEPGIDEKIVEGDKDDIIASDVLLVNYDKPSVGTSMEVLYAADSGKAVIVVAKEGTVISPWLKYHADVIVPSFARAFEYIAELQKAVDEYNRKYERDPFVRLEQMFDEMDTIWQRVFGRPFDKS